MNPVVKAQMDQFRRANPIENFSDSEYFEIYSTFSVMNGYQNDNIDPFEMHLKGHEFGIDGCGITVQGELVVDADSAEAAMSSNRDAHVSFTFLQAKTSEGFDYGEMSKFFDAVYGFFTDTMIGESDQLDELMRAKDRIYQSALRKNPDLVCFFVSTGNYNPVDRLEKLIAASQSRLNDLSLFNDVKIEIIDARRLQEAYRAATSSNSEDIEFPKCQTMPDHSNVQQAYIGYIKADQILQLATNKMEGRDFVSMNQTVFFDNIRDFNPKSKINEEIMSEIRSGDKHGFVFRNNGVTVVAKNINRTGDRFRVDDYQIVNGCQTSNILFQCKDHIDEIYVPFRLIGSRDDDFVTSIIIGTNNQNQVREEQFWALRPFMKDLEEYCKQQPGDLALYLERRENQYRNESIERTRIVKPSDLMKAVAAMYLFQPHRAARDFRGIRAEFDDVIFQPDHNVIPYHLACYANYKFEFLIQNKRMDRGIKIYKYYTIFALGYQQCGSDNIFKMSKSKQKQTCDTILDILSDESKFINFCEINAARLIEIVNTKFGGSTTATSRERLRDTLRSETFAMEFRKGLST